ncbi:hypothetical protein CcCBS67573_g08732 [Chytriomyces confervae]|uniref:Uncharacterized protein n=1 Tax=Chytriomyces confervae TaxID=246404 RepID=A0A507EJ75_9FUNG|nr:hypothetical protein CcCBS67573_g08732 [Chytriomyces confervae]
MVKFFLAVVAKADSTYSMQGLTVGREKAIKKMVLYWSPSAEGRWPGIFYVGTSQGQLALAFGITLEDLDKIGKHQLWARQHQEIQGIIQKSLELRQQLAHLGQGTPDDFRQLVTCKIAAVNPIQSMDIIQTVKGQHGSPEVRFHCLYMYYYQNVSKSKLSVLFGKVPSTISGWITQYEEGGGAARQARTNMYLRLGPERRKWVVSQFHKKPVMHLSKAKSKYALRYPGSTISAASISIILKEAGLSWKVLERRAIQICNSDVIRFSNELMSFPWLLQSLLFLDEASFDNRDMLASKGWGKKGESLVYVGEFV